METESSLARVRRHQSIRSYKMSKLTQMKSITYSAKKKCERVVTEKNFRGLGTCW